MIFYLGNGNIGMLFAIIISTRIAPIIGTLFGGKVTQTQTRAIGRRRITPQALPQTLPQE
jgi:hypothetical protein